MLYFVFLFFKFNSSDTVPSESATRITPLHIFILELMVSLSLLYFSDFDYVGAHPLVRDALAEMSEAEETVLAPVPSDYTRDYPAHACTGITP